MTDAGGLQASQDGTLQQQTAAFSEMVIKAQEKMTQQMEAFQETVDASMAEMISAVNSVIPEETPVFEVKHLDGGLWLNKTAMDAFLILVDEMQKVITELEKDVK